VFAQELEELKKNL